MNEKMKVLYIQVGKKPQVIEIKHTETKTITTRIRKYVKNTGNG